MPAERKSPDEPKHRRITLAQAIAQAVAKIPGAIGWELVKRRGRMEVKVKVNTDAAGCVEKVEG